MSEPRTAKGNQRAIDHRPRLPPITRLVGPAQRPGWSGELPTARRDAPPRPPERPTAPTRWLRRLTLAAGALALVGVAGVVAGAGLWSARLLPTDWLAELDRWTQGAGPSRPTPAATVADPSTLLGHFPYKEAPSRELVTVSAEGGYQLRRAAALAYGEMESAARADGIRLRIISAFRSIDQQQQVFFQVKAQRGQAASQRAEVSAPPGYSEHHTGYAIDLGDATAPSADLNPAFERTAAFAWLARHAARFNFELSFQRNNPQGVAYEPWHWRFVGDRASLETFYKSRQKGRPPAASPLSRQSPSPDSSSPAPASSP